LIGGRLQGNGSAGFSAPLTLEGGPGGSPLRSLVGQFGVLFGPLLKNNDLILFDQRGTGYSQPVLDCPEYNQLVLDTLDQYLSIKEAEEVSNAALLKCRDRLIKDGVNLAVYNSAQNAADIEALRQALNLSQINLYGISYGTRLALTMMRDFPQGIRSVTLDSVLPPQEDLYATTVTNGARALNALFDACAADAACNAAYPNLRQTFFDLKQRLDDAPVTFPVTVPDGSKQDMLLNGDSLVGLVFQGMYATSLLPAVPRLIVDIRDGNYALAAGLQSALLDQVERIVREHGGEIRAQSPVPQDLGIPAEGGGPGAVFSVELPLDQQERGDEGGEPKTKE
jgi:pimeloyl-ACP methyl ester carboxylesterase